MLRYQRLFVSPYIVSSAVRGRSARRRARPRRCLTGFTLIELVAVTGLIGLLAALAVPKYGAIVERARVAKAIGAIKALQTELQSQDSLPPTLAAINRNLMLDPWGRPYVYYKFPPQKGKAPPAGSRKDKFLVPVNSDFDLYSLGKDGASALAFTAKPSHDDVVRANDGGFIGLAKNF